jgi:hypothetical protein
MGACAKATLGYTAFAAVGSEVPSQAALGTVRLFLYLAGALLVNFPPPGIWWLGLWRPIPLQDPAMPFVT